MSVRDWKTDDLFYWPSGRRRAYSPKGIWWRRRFCPAFHRCHQWKLLVKQSDALSAKMKRRALPARRFGGESQALAADYRDSARQNQGAPLVEDGQPGDCRVGLPRSRP